MIAALLVFAHQTMVQFCCNGVTGAISAFIGGVLSFKGSSFHTPLKIGHSTPLLKGRSTRRCRKRRRVPNLPESERRGWERSP